MSAIFTDADERRVLVDSVAAERGVAPWVIEKDLWVCWLLARLHELEGVPSLTFKWGTSLSKVHGLIQRFSEDIDLTFSRDGWGFDGARDPLHPDLSGKRRRALLEELSRKASQVVADVVIPGLRAASDARLGPGGWQVTIDPDDPQAVLFAFPTAAARYDYGRAVVKVEFGARGAPWPARPERVVPYVEQTYEGTAAEAVSRVVTLAPERTFWEKATLMHALHHGTLVKPDKSVSRLSRHAYDLHRMWVDDTLRDTVLRDPSLLQAVVTHKMVFFKEGKARYELVQEHRLHTTPHPALQARLVADYEAMAAMFFPESPVPKFPELLQSLHEIDEAVAKWGPTSAGPRS